MATFNIKEENGKVIVEVTLPPLPKFAKPAREMKEVIREKEIRNYLKGKGIEVKGCLERPPTLTNVLGVEKVGIWIFQSPKPIKHQRVPKRESPPKEKVKKDLTTASPPVIIEEQPKKKRKRVKRVSKTGNQTTS